jgi:hypothetical protein
MTTPVKIYQNVSFAELLAFSENNPNRSTTLKRQEVKQIDERILHSLNLPDYISSVVDPAGILGICTCITDPNHYYMALPNVRTQMMIDLATSLQQRSDELKTSAIARKRKKIYDLIGAAYNKSALTDKDIVDLVQGISVLCNLQFILIKERVQESIEDDIHSDSAWKGDILFGTNPIHWTKENPIWIIDYHGRWLATPHTVTPDHIYRILGDWLRTIPQKGWTVQWPEIDATKTELVAALSTYAEWQENDRKLSKDVLSLRLGRVQTLEIIMKLSI